MGKPHILNRRIGTFLILWLLILLWPLMSAAASKHISGSDLDDADLIEFSSHIMSVDYEKGLLVVAEKVVMIVDLLIGGEQFTTQLTDPEGEVISIDSLHKGQQILVQGLKLHDGRIVASRI